MGTWVHGGRFCSGGCNISVQGRCDGHLTQVQGDLDGIVAQGYGFGGCSVQSGCTQHEDRWVVEVHLDGHFLHEDQQLAGVEQW